MVNRGFYNIARWRDFSHYDQEQRIGGLDQGLGGNELAVYLAMYVVVLLSLFLHSRGVILKSFFGCPDCTILLFHPLSILTERLSGRRGRVYCYWTFKKQNRSDWHSGSLYLLANPFANRRAGAHRDDEK